MKLDVNPTRMELLRLRRRIGLARRGHKLLKEKEEELMRRLIPLTKVVRELRRRVEGLLREAFHKFLIARGGMDPEVLESAIVHSQNPRQVETTTEPLLNLRLPIFRFTASKIQASRFKPSYGFWGTSGELDTALEEYTLALQNLITLAEKEKALQILAGELEKTRRRVRALEYRLIPDLEETTRFIQMKLSEVERSNLTRLMKVKDRIR